MIWVIMIPLMNMKEIFMSNQNIKLAYEGHYDFPKL